MPMVEPEVVRRAANAYIEMARALDTERYGEILALDAVRENPFGRLEGRQAIVDSAKQRWSRIASGRVDVDSLIVSGRSAAMAFTVHITAQNGKTATLRSIEVLDVNDDGLIQGLRMYYDADEFRAALS